MANSDRVYRFVVSLYQFFRRGWGPVETYERLAETLSSPQLNRTICQQIVTDHSHPVNAKKVSEDKHSLLYEGSFTSPLATYLPGVLPSSAETVRFEFLIPKEWKNPNAKPVYIHLAGTGDHFFWRRKHLFAYPLLKKHKIGTVMIENPFYGTRKPGDQIRSQLHHVSDLFLMGLALIFESMVIGNWIENIGMGPVGITGLSMGGYNASLTASLWPKPVPVVPCLSWSTASSVFTEGALSSAVSWNVLEEQLFNAKIGHNKRMKEIFDFVVDVQGKRYVSGILDAEKTTYSSMEENDFTNLRMKIKNDRTKQKEIFQPQTETVKMLRWMLDFTTHLNSYPQPLSPDLARIVIAKDDMYIPRHGVSDVRDLWPGCQVLTMDGGHISSYLMGRSIIMQAQNDIMEHFLYKEASGGAPPTMPSRPTIVPSTVTSE